MRAALGTALLLYLIASAADASAEPRRAIEVGVSNLFVRTTTASGDNTGNVSLRRSGDALAAWLAYRSPYFLSPYLEVAYYPLYERTRLADLGGAFGRATVTGALSAIGFTGGIGLRYSRLLLRAGIGPYDTMVTSTVRGATTKAAESDLGYSLTLDAALLETPRLRIGLETRAAFILEANTALFGLGVSIAGDALRF